MYCFHAYSIFDFVLDVLIAVFTLRVYFIEIDVKLITIYYLLFLLLLTNYYFLIESLHTFFLLTILPFIKHF